MENLIPYEDSNPTWNSRNPVTFAQSKNQRKRRKTPAKWFAHKNKAINPICPKIYYNLFYNTKTLTHRHTHETSAHIMYRNEHSADAFRSEKTIKNFRTQNYRRRLSNILLL